MLRVNNFTCIIETMEMLGQFLYIVTSVSYTHLDVYKRQRLYLAMASVNTISYVFPMCGLPDVYVIAVVI